MTKKDAKKYEKVAQIGEIDDQNDQDSAQVSDDAVPKDLRDQLVDVFNRDWQSPHCKIVE